MSVPAALYRSKPRQSCRSPRAVRTVRSRRQRPAVIRLLCNAGLLLLALPGPLAAQHYSLEANPIHGTAGYGWRRAEHVVVGVQVGFGFPQLDRKLIPADEEDLVDFAHVGAFARYRPSQRIVLDGAARLGLAELYGCSGCLPGLLGAVSGGVFLGGRLVKVGARLTAGVLTEDPGGTHFVAVLTPIAVLFALDR